MLKFKRQAARRSLVHASELPIETGGAEELSRHRESIEFSNVTLTYPDREVPAACWHFPPHSIWSNGCHHWSQRLRQNHLGQFAPGLVRPEQGMVQIDGVDINRVQVASLRQQMAMVTQDAMMLRGTIAENVDFGRRASVDEINAAIKIAEADFVHALPNGLETTVAEGGTSLSGGQRQRLAIARAVLRDPAILILDEATSQIDSESEAEIGRTMQAFGKDRTVLVVAHRPATILAADEVAVMDQGRIIDQGTNAELQSRCSLYRALWVRPTGSSRPKRLFLGHELGHHHLCLGCRKRRATPNGERNKQMRPSGAQATASKKKTVSQAEWREVQANQSAPAVDSANTSSEAVPRGCRATATPSGAVSDSRPKPGATKPRPVSAPRKRWNSQAKGLPGLPLRPRAQPAPPGSSMWISF